MAGRVPADRDRAVPPRQEIRFTRGRDGTRLAFAVHGVGPPLIVVSCWLSHLQHDWESPVWRHFLDDLGELSTLVRYDERGFGMSEWNVTDFSLAARLGDLEAVVDALGFERVSLLGMSDGSPIAMLYAARHPDRVGRLVLYGTICGERVVFEGDRLLEEQTYQGLVRIGWAGADPRFRRVFTQGFIPDATEEQMRWLDELQRQATSKENYLAARAARYREDITAEIPRIQAPTLILHAVGDRLKTFDNATEVASLIGGSRLVPLQSRNHILLEDEPAWQEFIAEVRTFMEPERMRWLASAPGTGSREAAPHEPLSGRELEVLRLAADGLANDAIAHVMGLSPRTVERHLSNAYSKLGLVGKPARAAAVAEVLRQGLA
ncbi:MAG TPA: alpha/beta fold hydrolase [Candidatus Limnocylindrales bacterium]|nr:alpha/beta fold hydrolase [Candidatus Limnocylindrales bacterium]